MLQALSGSHAVPAPGLGFANGLFVLADGTHLACPQDHGIYLLSPSGHVAVLAGRDAHRGMTILSPHGIIWTRPATWW